MANEWNVAYPIDHTKIGDIPTEIRKLKTSTKTQIGHEHETPVDGDATGSEHSSGSAVAYEGTSTPTTRPDGSTALADNAIDRGRLWLDDNGDPPNLKRWTGSAFTESVRALGGWTPTTYAGEESITLPNGLVIKLGSASSTQDTQETFAFAAAFSTAIMGVWTQRTDAGASHVLAVDSQSVANFTINRDDTIDGSVGFNWIAIGY
jgi:hypothetical protein